MSEPTWELLGGGGVVGGPIDYVGDWAAGTHLPAGAGRPLRRGGLPGGEPVDGAGAAVGFPVPAGMVCIYDQRLSADAASFDVQNISQGYAHLKIVASLRGTVAGALGDAHMRFNNDTANNYDGQWTPCHRRHRRLR